jgi:hypothetical protein
VPAVIKKHSAKENRHVDARARDQYEFTPNRHEVVLSFILAEQRRDHADRLAHQVGDVLDQPEPHRVVRHRAQTHERRQHELVQAEVEDGREAPDHRRETVTEHRLEVFHLEIFSADGRSRLDAVSHEHARGAVRQRKPDGRQREAENAAAPLDDNVDGHGAKQVLDDHDAGADVFAQVGRKDGVERANRKVDGEIEPEQKQKDAHHANVDFGVNKEADEKHGDQRDRCREEAEEEEHVERRGDRGLHFFVVLAPDGARDEANHGRGEADVHEPVIAEEAADERPEAVVVLAQRFHEERHHEERRPDHDDEVHGFGCRAVHQFLAAVHVSYWWRAL